MNSNYFFIVITSACIASEKNQGNEGQPNSESQQDVTCSPTGVNCQSIPIIQYEKKKVKQAIWKKKNGGKLYHFS